MKCKIELMQTKENEITICGASIVKKLLINDSDAH